MISLKGNNVWKRSDKIYSTMTLTMDENGNVLFIHSRSPFSTHEFIGILLSLPIRIEDAMYVEGGPEAVLYIRTDNLETESVGSYETKFFESDDNVSGWPLPNVIGIKPKNAAT